MRIGPAGTYSPITGPVEVKAYDTVLAKYGNSRDATHFARGYNQAYWEADDVFKRVRELAEALHERTGYSAVKEIIDLLPDL
jgi:hypothetical protein